MPGWAHLQAVGSRRVPLIAPDLPRSGCGAGTSSSVAARRTSPPKPVGPASTSGTGSGTTTSRCALPAPRRTVPRSNRRRWPNGPRRDCPWPRSPRVPATAPVGSTSCCAVPACPPDRRSPRSPAPTWASWPRWSGSTGMKAAAWRLSRAAFGRGPDWARARVRAAGLAIRPGGTTGTGLDVEQLRRWRLDDGLTFAEIATRAGRSTTTVAEALRRAGVTGPARRPEAPALDPAVLRRFYVDERRTLGQVAAALGASDRRVRAAIVAAGIPLRPARRRADRAALPTLTAEQLGDLYLRQRLTTREIAARYGGSDNWVRTALEAHGIDQRTGGARPVPRLELDAGGLTDLYVTRRLDDPAIAARYGVPTWRVTTRRRELGVTRPPVPPPHREPPPAPPAAELRRLYLDERLPTAAIGARYDTDPKTARRWLRAAGIPVRPRTAREHRHTLDITELRELYQHRQWTVAEIAAHLDSTIQLILRALHDAGVPVRRSGIRPRRRPPDDTQLLAALCADPDVTAVLRRHRTRGEDS